jgi:hypothetical protein
MSNLEDQQSGLVRYYGVQFGFVTDIADPMGLHRVKVNIDGIAEPETDWLFPMIDGGGSADRGGHIVPDVGAKCAVWFHNGDPQGQGVYQPVAWSNGDAGSEVPYDARNAGAKAHLVQTLRVGRIIATVDETPGSESFKIYDAQGGFSFQCDLVKKIAALTGLVGLQLSSTGQVDITGIEVTINGRRVNTTSSPI